jgi:poly(3-hydroxybutyrate) depolymerase
VIAGACGGEETERGVGVTSEVVSHESTQNIRVFAPERVGAWPVVFALHGIDGSADHMAELGWRQAREGLVVCAPNCRTDLTAWEGAIDLVRDIECGYRFARSIAADYGGDLHHPVTFVGWSLGASLAIQGGLDEHIDPTEEFISCFAEVRGPTSSRPFPAATMMPPSTLNSAEWTPMIVTATTPGRGLTPL